MTSLSDYWEPDLKKCLLETLESSQAGDYAVFDFDNTLVFFDVEDHLMMYLIDTLSLIISPDELLSIMTDPHFSIENQVLNLPTKPILLDLALDIYDLYQEVLADDNNMVSPAYQSLSAKLRYYYQYVKKHIKPILGKPWLTYWYSGYNQKSFQDLCFSMLDYYLNDPIQYREWSSHPSRPGRTGLITTNFEQGIRLSEDFLDLFKLLQEAKIEIYIISASPKLLVQATAKYFNLTVPESNIFGKEIIIEDTLTPIIASNSYLTKYQGKVDLIQKIIQPRHDGKDPIIVAGDSSGDYQMLTAFNNLKLGLIINRNTRGPLLELTNGEKYFLQGRDEIHAQLLPQRTSLLLKQRSEMNGESL